LLSFETVNLQANVEFKGKYVYMTLDSETESQECRAILSITEPEEILDERYFLIEARDVFDFAIKLDKKVFVKNENINIGYESSLTPEINAVLTYPDGEKQNIALPTTITASQIGTYNLEVTASKEDYKTVSITEQFGVIEKQAEFFQGEPQDRSESERTATKEPVRVSDIDEIIKENYIPFIIILAVLIILIVVMVYFLLNKKR
jgi:hypothetical protein